MTDSMIERVAKAIDAVAQFSEDTSGNQYIVNPDDCARAAIEAYEAARPRTVLPGAAFVASRATGYHVMPLANYTVEDCVFFTTEAAYEAWLLTPEGIAWRERRDSAIPKPAIT